MKKFTRERVAPIISASVADGPSEDKFDFHLPILVDAAELTRLLGDVAMAAP